MSLSPSSSFSDDRETPQKRRRFTSVSEGARPEMTPRSILQQTSPASQSQIPKRGARACTACRKGKNRCEGEPICRRCQISGTACVFEKPEKKIGHAMSSASAERLSRLEGQYLVMQSQMIGMQSSLDRILAAVQSQSRKATAGPSQDTRFGSSESPKNALDADSEHPKFPPLPGYLPPPHKYATYGIVSDSATTSEDESEDTLPRATLDAPIEALQGLANAAAEAAAIAPNALPSVKKRKRPEPVPRNAFPHVVDKGLVSESEAKELFHIFFSGCHLFIPLFDPLYDTYESLKERSPWTFDAILAIGSKIRSGSGPLSSSFYKCLNEAQGIARSTLFGPIVKKEAVQGMLLLAAWSTNGWLPSGHALRMALDLGLHRALGKLAEETHKRRSEEEERELVVSARIWLCLYWFDHQMCLGIGRPIVLRDESSIKHARILLNHAMSTPTDVRLIAQVELISQKTQIYETLTPLNGPVNHSTLALIRRANVALEKWYTDCDELHRQMMDEECLLRKILEADSHYAKLWLICVVLRGVSWDWMPFEQRELAFQAKDAAFNCLSIFLLSPAYRAALRYAVHDTLVTAAFSALFLLKMANLFPTELDLGAIINQVEQLVQVFFDVAAERYALTLRIMLANLRRKIGLIKGSPMSTSSMASPPTQEISQTMNDGGPSHVKMGMYAQDVEYRMGHVPPWIQDQGLTDLGLPINGHDGIFPPVAPPGAPLPEAW